MAHYTGLIGTLAGVVGTFAGVLISRFILGPRDRQDREVEWRKHAIELTKLDLERKIKSRSPNAKTPLRPSILDFLANYRDLQELGNKTPTELYLKIEEDRISRPDPSEASEPEKKSGGKASFISALCALIGKRPNQT